MAVYYLDTSALVKRYALEDGTAWVLALTDPVAGHDLYTVRLTDPEMIAAFYRKARNREISLDEASQAAQQFRTDWRVQYQIAEVKIGVADRAMVLAEQHGLRGYDAVHLATALELQGIRAGMELPPLTFVSADDDQLRVAMTEGLRVDNPSQHPQLEK